MAVEELRRCGSPARAGGDGGREKVGESDEGYIAKR